jgi:hypothetical protein
VAWLAWVNDVARTLRSGLDVEQKGEEEGKGGEGRGERKEPNVVEVENGGCFVLE